MFLVFSFGVIFSPSFLSFAYGNTNNTDAITREYQKLLLAIENCFEKQCSMILGVNVQSKSV